MRGFNPELILKNVRVFDSEERQSLLAFDEINVGLDMLRFLTQGELTPAWVSVVGANLTIRRQKEGGLTLVGLKSNDDSPSWLFEDGYFALLNSNIRWQDLKRGGREVQFSDVDISIANAENQHQIGVAVDLPEALGKKLTVSMDYQGNLFLPDCCNGQLYVEGEGIHLANLFAGQPLMGYEIGNGLGSFQLWSDWENSRVQSVSGQLKLQKPALRIAANSVSLEHLEGWFRWRKHLEGWRLDANKLHIGFEENRWPSSRLAVKAAYGADGEIETLNATASYLGIEDLIRLLSASDILSKKQQADLTQISPKGEMRDFSVRYVNSASGAQVVGVCGDFNRIELNSWEDYPRLKNLSGFVCTDFTHGVIGLESKEVEVNLPTLFRQPLAFESLSGKINWEHTGDNWKIGSENIHIVNREVDAFTRFELDLDGENVSPRLDLQVAFDGKNAKNVPLYLPVTEMDEDVVDWLDHAFMAGRVDNGQLLFHGPVQAFPFDQGEGVFQCRFDVGDSILVYHEDWPEITELEGDVRFDNRLIVINAGSGKISGATIDNAVITIPDMVDGDILTVLGNVHGDVEQTTDFLSRSPLRYRIDPLLQIAEFKGKNRINLELEIPLDDDDLEAKVKGIAEFNDSLIHLGALDLVVTGVNGHFSFTDDALAIDDLSGVMLDAPMGIRLSTRDQRFDLQVDSVASINALKQQFPYSFWNDMGGKADYRMLLKIPKRNKAGPLSTKLSLTTNLKGLEIWLPEPLGKPKTSKKAFRLDLTLAQSEKTPIRLRYADIARADFVFSEPESEKFKFERGSVSIGGNSPEAGNSPGLNVSVQLNELNLEPWWLFYTSKSQGQDSSPELLNSVRLETGKLKWDDQDFGPVSLHVDRQETAWLAGIKSQYVTGQATIPSVWSSDALLTMNFESIKIPGIGERPSAIEGQAFFEPAKLPKLALKSERLFWKDIDLGKIEVRTRRQRHGLDIDYFAVESDNHMVLLTGHWTQEDMKDATHIQGQLDAQDLGLLLAQLKISEDIKESTAEIGFDFLWNGTTPHQFSLDQLNGKVTLEFGPGRLLGIEPGLGRAFGVFNLDTWRRRLAFEFSDLYAEGMAYDKVEGEFVIEDSNATTENFEIDAVAARIFGKGKIGLIAKDFNVDITVVPKSTASLPIAGAIAGGPAVGAAIYVAQKLIGDDVDSLASIQYTMTGQWGDPQIVRLPGKGGMLDRAWYGIMDFGDLNTEPEVSKEKLE